MLGVRQKKGALGAENHRKTIAGETLGVPGQKCLSAHWNVILSALRERFLTEGD